MSDEEANPDDVVRLAAALSTEQGRFLRRTCPSCDLDFKTEVDSAQLQWLIAPAVQRVGTPIGVSLKSTDNPPVERVDYFYCPYCDARVNVADTFTEETIRYVHRVLMREVVLPKIHATFAPLADLRGGGGVTFDYQRGVLPPRPLHGPEPPDMVVIEFLCCTKRGKVLKGWARSVHHCLYCGTPVSIV